MGLCFSIAPYTEDDTSSLANCTQLWLRSCRVAPLIGDLRTTAQPPGLSRRSTCEQWQQGTAVQATPSACSMWGQPGTLTSACRPQTLATRP